MWLHLLRLARVHARASAAPTARGRARPLAAVRLWEIAANSGIVARDRNRRMIQPARIWSKM